MATAAVQCKLLFSTLAKHDDLCWVVSPAPLMQAARNQCCSVWLASTRCRANYAMFSIQLLFILHDLLYCLLSCSPRHQSSSSSGCATCGVSLPSSIQQLLTTKCCRTSSSQHLCPLLQLHQHGVVMSRWCSYSRRRLQSSTPRKGTPPHPHQPATLSAACQRRPPSCSPSVSSACSRMMMTAPAWPLGCWVSAKACLLARQARSESPVQHLSGQRQVQDLLAARILHDVGRVVWHGVVAWWASPGLHQWQWSKSCRAAAHVV